MGKCKLLPQLELSTAVKFGLYSCQLNGDESAAPSDFQNTFFRTFVPSLFEIKCDFILREVGLIETSDLVRSLHFGEER